MMKKEAIFILCGWITITTSILMTAIYQTSIMQWYHYVIFFASSFLAGVLLTDPQKIVIYTFITLSISCFLALFCLSLLPILAGKVLFAFETFDMLLRSGIVIIVRITFPQLWILYFIGALIGGVFGERFSGAP